jgi:hypothetical protein
MCRLRGLKACTGGGEAPVQPPENEEKMAGKK